MFSNTVDPPQNKVFLKKDTLLLNYAQTIEYLSFRDLDLQIITFDKLKQPEKYILTKSS